jgi:hypothetical protein
VHDVRLWKTGWSQDARYSLGNASLMLAWR